MKGAATEDVWSQFRERLRGFIAKRVGQEGDVDDVLQEVFLRIHGGLPGLKASEKLEPWLFAVAHSAVADHFRSRSGKRRPAEWPGDLPEDDPAPSTTAEIASWLEPMMSALPREDREALRQADLEGLKQKELAARLGLSLSGAKSRLQRARRRLRQALLDCCHIDLDRRGNAIGYTPKRRGCGSGSCSCS